MDVSVVTPPHTHTPVKIMPKLEVPPGATTDPTMLSRARPSQTGWASWCWPGLALYLAGQQSVEFGWRRRGQLWGTGGGWARLLLPARDALDAPDECVRHISGAFSAS